MRSIPVNNLGYPVLIRLSNGSTGSSFLLSVKSQVFLVTAKHVLFDGDKLRSNVIELTCQTSEITDSSVTKYKVNLETTKAIKHKKADVAIIKMFSTTELKENHFRHNLVDGVERIVKGNFPIITVAEKITKLIKEVLVSNDIFLYGYPSSIGLKNLPQFDYSKPLLRKGIVAGIYPEMDTIIIDCPVYYGNSGGPVVEVEKIKGKDYHKVIGVVSQLIPYVQTWVNPPTGTVNTEHLNSGYSVLVSMDKVFELIKEQINS